MYRTMIAIAAMMGSAAAYAAPPVIAYAKAGVRGDAIYLVEPDGSRLTKIYQGRAAERRSAPIEAIAMRIRGEDTNGGGEVAFVEDNLTIKVQRHDSNGQPEGNPYQITVPNGVGCGFGDLDYLSNGTLVIADSCTNVWTVAPGDMAPGSTTPLFQAAVNSLAALGDDILYVDGAVLKRRTSGGTTTPLRTVSNPYFFLDASATMAFLSEWSATTFQTVDLSSPYDVDQGCTQAGRVEVSPNGSQMIYWYRNEMLLHASDCIGQTPTRVARGVRVFAWRTY